MKKRILILYDNRGYVASSLLPEAKRKVNIELLANQFRKLEFDVEVKSLHDLQFPTNYKDWYVIYPSSEDYGLFYKEYIEDVLLRLKLDGAILLPEFEFFRAHHNKVFMELLKTKFRSKELKTIKSYTLYGKSDLEKLLMENKITYPIVIKTSEGSGSIGVDLAKTEDELIKKVKKMGKINFSSGVYSKKIKFRHFIGHNLRKIQKKNVVEQPEAREKIVIQTFISNLEYDYKVLVFGTKFYLLRRDVRKNDFRASGSGKLHFVENFESNEEKVLDFALLAYEEIGTPLLSIDIAYDGEKCHMIEYQCLNFGPYTLQFSKWYYRKENNQWKVINDKSILEVEMANAIDYYIRNKSN